MEKVSPSRELIIDVAHEAYNQTLVEYEENDPAFRKDMAPSWEEMFSRGGLNNPIIALYIKTVSTNIDILEQMGYVLIKGSDRGSREIH